MRKLLLFFSLIVWSELGEACDFCNCYLGINPHYKKNRIGLRHTNSTYYGSHLSQTELDSYNLTAHDFKETRNNYELNIQYYPVQKLQLQLYLPYIINAEQMSDKAYTAFTAVPINGNRVSHAEPAHDSHVSEINQSSTIQGIGDPLLLAQYQLFNLGSQDSGSLKQRLFAGLGVKFPLGKSKFDAEDPLEKSHQPGSGSWDILPSISYLAKIKRIGVNFNSNYMFTTQDKNQFKFANRLNANVNLYYELQHKKLYAYPSLGMYFEQCGNNSYKVERLENSGGILLLLHSGLDFYYKKFSLSTFVHLPLLQNLNGYQPILNQRVSISLGYVFN
jgi:hypothetical protein